MRQWIMNDAQGDVIPKRDGATIRITLGPDKSWFVYEGKLSLVLI